MESIWSAPWRAISEWKGSANPCEFKEEIISACFIEIGWLEENRSDNILLIFVCNHAMVSCSQYKKISWGAALVWAVSFCKFLLACRHGCTYQLTVLSPWMEIKWRHPIIYFRIAMMLWTPRDFNIKCEIHSDLTLVSFQQLLLGSICCENFVLYAYKSDFITSFKILDALNPNVAV